MAATPPGRSSYPASRRAPQPRRRRRRSVRVVTAVWLLVVATVGVLVALATGSPAWLAAASVLALALVWAALRTTWLEVTLARRDNAADRAAAALAYRDLYVARVAEHADVTAAMTERLACATLSQHHLEGQVARQRQRAETAEARLAEVQAQLLAGRRDPDVVELAGWERDSTPARPGVARVGRA